MTKKIFLSGILAVALVFGMIVTGCGDKGGDPIDVNLSLPGVPDIPAYTGTFVSSEDETKVMIADAMAAMDEAFGGIVDRSESRYNLNTPHNMSRAVVQNEPFQEIINIHEDGADVTGFNRWLLKNVSS
jgi:hypothetical protein